MQSDGSKKENNGGTKMNEEKIIGREDIPIDKIKPSPYQPRLTFDLEDIREGIRKDGLLIPLTIRRKDGHCELIDGERRLRVLKEKGYKIVPCDVIDIDDETARRTVYKVNKDRKNYTAEEEARFFKKLNEEEGMKPYEIETQLRVKHSWVQACLNVWKFPKDIQDTIFAPRGKVPYKVYLTDIRDLEKVINRNIDESVAILREIIDKRATADEKREIVGRREKKIDEERIKKVEEVISKIEGEAEKLETAEDYERVAKTLRERAKELKTPEQILEEKQEKARSALLEGKGNVFSKIERAKELGIDTSEFEGKLEAIKAKLSDDPDEAFNEAKELKDDIGKIIKDFEEKQREAKIREEAMEEAKKKLAEEMLSKPGYVERVVEEKAEEVVKAEPPRIIIPPEEAKRIRERYDELKQRVDRILQDPEVKKRGRLFRNWHSHYILLQGLQNSFCPNCGEEKSGKLIWSCCGSDVEKGLKMAGDKYEESQ